MELKSLKHYICNTHTHFTTFVSQMKLSAEDENHKEEVQGYPTQGDQNTLIYLSVTYPHT